MDSPFSSMYINLNFNNKNILIEEDKNNIETEINLDTEIEIDSETTIKYKKKYDSKKYNNTFYIKNNDKIKQKEICKICGGNYTYYNKSAHNKTNKHIKVANIMGIII